MGLDLRPARARQKWMVCRPFWIALSGQKMFSDFSEGVALGYDGSGLWPVTILPSISERGLSSIRSTHACGPAASWDNSRSGEWLGYFQAMAWGRRYRAGGGAAAPPYRLPGVARDKRRGTNIHIYLDFPFVSFPWCEN
jgi:hypothetical protein